MPIRKTAEHDEARRLRAEEGLTLVEIAKRLGIHKSTAQEWLADIPGPPRHSLTDMDSDKRTATCQVCGPTKVRKNGPRWLCLATVQRYYDEVVERSQKAFYDYLCGLRCLDCGYSNPMALEFDHVNEDKKYNVSDMVRKGYKWETVLAEIKKCEVVCANCHRIRTNRRGGWFRYVHGT